MFSVRFNRLFANDLSMIYCVLRDILFRTRWGWGVRLTNPLPLPLNTPLGECVCACAVFPATRAFELNSNKMRLPRRTNSHVGAGDGDGARVSGSCLWCERARLPSVCQYDQFECALARRGARVHARCGLMSVLLVFGIEPPPPPLSHSLRRILQHGMRFNRICLQSCFFAVFVRCE